MAHGHGPCQDTTVRPSTRQTLELSLCGMDSGYPPLSLGVRGSFDEQTWRAALERFGLKGAKATEFMTELTARCLAEADELFNVRAAALRANDAE